MGVTEDFFSSGEMIKELKGKLIQTEAAIKKLGDEKQRIERITFISPSIITVYDCKKKKNTFQNRSLAEMLGY